MLFIKLSHFLIFTSFFSTSMVNAGALELSTKHIKGIASYSLFAGKPVSNTIELFGNGKGKYCVNGRVCGALFDIKYADPEGDIVGKWQMNGTRGTFKWNLLSDTEFDGGFHFNQTMTKDPDTNSIYVPLDGVWSGQFK